MQPRPGFPGLVLRQRFPVRTPRTVLTRRNPARPGGDTVKYRPQHGLVRRTPPVSSVQHLQPPHFDDANLSHRPGSVTGKAKVSFP